MGGEPRDEFGSLEVEGSGDGVAVTENLTNASDILGMLVMDGSGDTDGLGDIGEAEDEVVGVGDDAMDGDTEIDGEMDGVGLGDGAKEKEEKSGINIRSI